MEFLDARQAAELLQLNEYTVRRLAREALIPAHKIGGVWRFDSSMLRLWFQRSAHPGTGKVLAVDDDRYMRDMIETVLGREGHEVRTAPDGPEALATLHSFVPDLVLLDLNMPEMSGPEVLKRIRELLGNVPVLVLTGYPDSELVDRALKYAPITLLTKDISRQDLVREVHRHIQLGRMAKPCADTEGASFERTA